MGLPGAGESTPASHHQIARLEDRRPVNATGSEPGRAGIAVGPLPYRLVFEEVRACHRASPPNAMSISPRARVRA